LNAFCCLIFLGTTDGFQPVCAGMKLPEAGQPGSSGNIQDLTQHFQFSVAPEI
jgi:hypothetical protein